MQNKLEEFQHKMHDLMRYVLSFTIRNADTLWYVSKYYRTKTKKNTQIYTCD